MHHHSPALRPACPPPGPLASYVRFELPHLVPETHHAIEALKGLLAKCTSDFKIAFGHHPAYTKVLVWVGKRKPCVLWCGWLRGVLPSDPPLSWCLMVVCHCHGQGELHGEDGVYLRSERYMVRGPPLGTFALLVVADGWCSALHWPWLPLSQPRHVAMLPTSLCCITPRHCSAPSRPCAGHGQP